MKFNHPKTVAFALCFGCGAAIGYITSDNDSEAADLQIDASKSHAHDTMTSIQPQALENRPKKTEAIDPGAVLSGDPIERMEMLIGNEALDRNTWERFTQSLDAMELRRVVDEFSLKGYSTGTENFDLFNILWSEWAKKDPDYFLEKSLALEFYDDTEVNKIPEDEFSWEKDSFWISSYQETAIRQLAATDTQKAIQWCIDHNDGYVASVINRIAEEDVDRALEIVCALPESAKMESALTEITAFFENRGSEKAYGWAFGIENEKIRSMAIAGITSKLAVSDTMGAARQLLSNPGEDTAKAMSMVMARMSEQDFKAAVDYFNGIEDGMMKSHAFAGLITEDVATQDPGAVISLLDANPSAVTDDLALTLIKGAYANDAQLAISNIQRVRNPQLRQQTYQSYLLKWLRDDPEKTHAWLQSNDIPEDMRLGIGNLINQLHQTTTDSGGLPE